MYLNYSQKRELQLSEFEILKEFKILCEKHGLKYYLTAGTLLGAVRHKGFIPWDDDIDIAMPRADFDRLAEICETDLSNKYYYQDSFTEIRYPYFFAKIRIDNTTVYEPCLKDVNIRKGRYIDIFPLDGCPNNKHIAKLYFKIIGLFSSVYMGKVSSSFECGYKKKYAKALFRLISCLSLEEIRKCRQLIAVIFTKLCTLKLCTVGGIHGYPAETYNKEWFDGSEQMIFENEWFPVPSGWESLLTNMYGDYMIPPDEMDKSGHFEIEG